MRFQDPIPKTNRNPNTAIALSFVPGLGQIYNLQPRKGIIFLIVGFTNFVILSTLVMSAQIMANIQTFSQSFDVKPNHELLITFSQLNWSSPSVLLLSLLFVAFVLFSMRDAYDIAAKSTRKAIYAEELLEISEANSASYLFHISLMVSFLILAFFFLVPPKPKQQITNIEFIQSPEKEIQKPTKAKDFSNVNRKPQKKVNQRKNQFKTNPKTKHSPKTKTNSPPKVAQTRPVPVPVRSGRASIPTPQIKPMSQTHSNPLLALLPKQTKKSSSANIPNLLALKPNANKSINPKVVAPIVNSGTLAPQAPERKNNVGKGTSNGLAPSIIPSSRMESSSSANKVRTLSKIGSGKNPSSKSNHAGIPAPARVNSGSNKNIKDLISIKPSVGSSNLRPASGSTDAQPGSSDSGADSEKPEPPVVFKPKFSNYMARLQRKIKQHWFPPKDQLSKRVKVIFTIHTNGKMTNLKLVRPSGSAKADKAALNAVRSAAPFQHLPKHSPASVDVEFTFDYNVFKSSGRRW